MNAQELNFENCDTLDTQYAIHMCASKNFAKADSQLNVVYKNILSQLEPVEKKALVKSQKSWLKYRNDSEDFIGTFSEGGSMQTTQILLYSTKLTLERTKELRFILKYKYGSVAIQIQ